MSYQLSDRFGPIPCKDYADILGALSAAKNKAVRMGRTITIGSDKRRHVWHVSPTKQVSKRLKNG